VDNLVRNDENIRADDGLQSKTLKFWDLILGF
jgi:hypothetical protein